MPRITQLPSLTTADNSDEIAIVDTSASVTKKITRGDLLKAPLPSNSVTTAAITDSSVTTAKIGNAQVTAPKIDFATFSKRRNNGVNGNAQNMHVAGWAGAMATAASSISISVTFGVTFTEPPIVTAVYGGDKASGAVSWPVGVGVKRGYVAAHSITTTGFTVTIYSSDGSNWSTANSVYAQWSAFGSVE